MNTQKNVNFLQKPLCPSFTQLLIKFPQMNFLRVNKTVAIPLFWIQRVETQKQSNLLIF